jgi:hypothetical protein|tara:strand:+ start:2686 stop:3129 length:444 start_codon:yes stop_codon:yes gene_type:complete
MAFSGNFMCTSFKKELLEAKHNFLNSGGSTFQLALYTNSASFTAATTAYTTSNEISNTAGSAYSAKGNTLTRVDPSTSGTTALTDFADSSWSSASFTARGALVFNDSASGDPSVVVLDFGADKTASNGTFTVVFPTADASNAIIRIA